MALGPRRTPPHAVGRHLQHMADRSHATNWQDRRPLLTEDELQQSLETQLKEGSRAPSNILPRLSSCGFRLPASPSSSSLP